MLGSLDFLLKNIRCPQGVEVEKSDIFKLGIQKPQNKSNADN